MSHTEQMREWIETLKSAHDESLDDEGKSSRSIMRGVIDEMEAALTAPAAEVPSTAAVQHLREAWATLYNLSADMEMAPVKLQMQKRAQSIRSYLDSLEQADGTYAATAAEVPQAMGDAGIEATITKAVREGRLSWLGFKKDDQGAYTIPVLSPSDYQAARAVIDARDAQRQSTRLRGGVPEGHAPYSINEIEAWADDADKHGLKFVPVSSATLRLIVGGLRATRCGVPEGWRLVPVEPTDDMVKAALHLDLSYMPGQEGPDRAAVYTAMLTAAPQAPALDAATHPTKDTKQ